MAFSGMGNPKHEQKRHPLNQGHGNAEQQTSWPKPIGELLADLQIPEKMLNGESFLARQYQERKAAVQQKRNATDQLAENALDTLEESLKNGKSETLVQFLTTMSRFHSYSLNNQMLIMTQRPDATRVAGFNAWKKLGRFVRKGEKGIGILAPMIGKTDRDESQPKEAEEEPARRVYGFRVASVFDISQTDGKPLPDISQILGKPGVQLTRLQELISAHGIKLEYDNLNGPEGVSLGGTILVESNLDEASEFSVLAHELAHELLHRGDRRKETTKKLRELEAEAVSFVVCQAAGIDSLARSTDYIQLYQGNSESLSQSLNHIRKTATEIISGLSCD